MTEYSLANIPATFQKQAGSLRKQRWITHFAQDTPIWNVKVNGRVSLLAACHDRLLIVSAGSFGGSEFELLYKELRGRIQLSGVKLGFPDRVAGYYDVHFDSADEAQKVAGLIESTSPGRRDETSLQSIIIVTTNDVPGYEIVDVHGDVFGLVVRARNIFSNMGASLRTIVGGEVDGYTKLLSDSRHDARSRMAGEAASRGANAVVARRFDCNEIADVMSEVAAYGTAVTVRKIDAGNRQ